MQTAEIIIIAGPTASGKSGLALDLAKDLNGVIINADSMQVYKDIPILAATPSAKDMAQIPHKLYGIYDAAVRGNMVDWFDCALKEINTARQNKQTPIIVGGTGMYIETIEKGVTPIPDTPPEVKKEIAAMEKELGLAGLYAILREKDPATAERLSKNDTTRIKRALEVYTHTKKGMSYWQTVPLKQYFSKEELSRIYIKPPRELLDVRARMRFDIMLNQGAVQEVENLLKKKLPDSLPAMRALGVQEIKAYLNGNCSLEEASELAKLHTRQYAKRQTTWFNNRFSPDFIYDSCYEEDKNFVDDIKKAL